MLRDIDLNAVSDGKLYMAKDMARIDCHDCKGCSECCRGMGQSIMLDPYDIYNLTISLDMSCEQLLSRYVEFGVDGGVIIPNMRMQENTGACGFLTEEGRCSVHDIRPGICRLFPLGRYYDGEGFKYFLQVNECSKKDRTKMKIFKYLGIDDLPKYEKFVCDWHYFILDVQKKLNENPESFESANEDNIFLLNLFYMMVYNRDVDFYTQFYERLALAKNRLFG